MGVDSIASCSIKTMLTWLSSYSVGELWIPLHSKCNSVYTGMQSPQLQELIDNVVIVDWQRFGLELKIDDRTLTQIDSDSALKRIQDKLREVFRIWLKESDEECTWLSVVNALKVIKEKRLAREIEKKFCK